VGARINPGVEGRLAMRLLSFFQLNLYCLTTYPSAFNFYPCTI
jgi:hypothetical protein